MADEQPNADTTVPGSTESFNDFKDRILGAMTGIQAENEGHNTVIVSHSKALGVMDAWRHAGMPEDNSIHMPTFEADNIKPGGHEEYKIPEHVMLDRQEKQPSALVPLDRDVGFDQQGNPMRLSTPDPLNIGSMVNTNPIENPEMLVGMSGKFLDISVIKQLRAQGLQWKEIANKYDMNHDALLSFVRRNDPTYKTRDVTGRPPGEFSLDEFKRLYDSGVSHANISKQLKIGAPKVRQIIKDLNLTR